MLCFPGWLQLQARRWVVQEGDPITLRCHSWKNRTVYKVQYFQNGRGKKFYHQNTEFHIPKAEGKHNGSYFCRGMVGGTQNESSKAMNVVVQGERAAGLEGPGPGLLAKPPDLSEPVSVTKTTDRDWAPVRGLDVVLSAS